MRPASVNGRVLRERASSPARRSKSSTGPTGRQSRKGKHMIRVSGYASVEGFDVL